MENRGRFLYCCMTELRGRMWKAGAGKGKTGTSEGGGVQEKPHINPKTRRGAKESSEVREPCAKKSRYGLYSTRTENRHRWMRRES